MAIGIFGTVLLTANRFLTIILPLRYTLLMTTSKSRFVVVITWFIKFAHSTVFYVAVYCQAKGLRYFLSLVFYGMIFRAARRQIKRIQDQNIALRSVGVGFVAFKRTLNYQSVIIQLSMKVVQFLCPFSINDQLGF